MFIGLEMQEKLESEHGKRAKSSWILIKLKLFARPRLRSPRFASPWQLQAIPVNHDLRLTLSPPGSGLPGLIGSDVRDAELESNFITKAFCGAAWRGSWRVWWLFDSSRVHWMGRNWKDNLNGFYRQKPKISLLTLKFMAFSLSYLNCDCKRNGEKSGNPCFHPRHEDHICHSALWHFCQ